MRRLLLIAHPFSPAILPGSPRTWSIATRLQCEGWQVDVVTVNGAQWRRRESIEDIDAKLRALGIERVEAADSPLLFGELEAPRWWPSLGTRVTRRLLHWTQIDAHLFWYRRAEAAIAKRYRRGDVDVVMASVPPFGQIAVAERVAARLGCPFVIDYRDLWTMNPTHVVESPARHVRAERRLTANAAAILTVSHSLAELLDQKFGVGAKVHVLHNGFDRAVLDGVQPARFDHFAIVYAGSFYFPNRTVHPLLRALARVHATSAIARDWKFHYYGTQDAHVLEVAAEVGLPRERVVCHGAVRRAEALAAVAGADLAAIITTTQREGTAGDRGIVTGKIFEAIGLRRPLLVIAPVNSDVEKIVDTAGLGIVMQGPETERIAEAIVGVANGNVIPPRNPEAFDWAALAPRLSDVLTRAIGGTA